MRAATLATGAMFTMALGVSVTQMLLPFSPRRPHHTGRHAKPVPQADQLPSDGRLGGARAWLRWWRKSPRPALKAQDWLPRGFLFLPTLVGFGSSVGAFDILVSPHQTFRLGGFLAMIGGILLLTLVVLYVLRPWHPNP